MILTEKYLRFQCYSAAQKFAGPWLHGLSFLPVGLHIFSSQFLHASAAMLKHVSYTNSICLSVRSSVTRWYCIKTAEHIVMLSSPHDSPFILVLCVPRSSRNSDGVTPCGAAKQRWSMKCRNFRPITCYISETVEDRALNPLSIHVTFTAIVAGA